MQLNTFSSHAHESEVGGSAHEVDAASFDGVYSRTLPTDLTDRQRHRASAAPDTQYSHISVEW